ncbi:hypothetical protein FQ186_05145 [Pseudomonas sp. ANT_H14]|uniref:hypothetical protein n=1 Tax=unclassified Pseudomonas TaxID=196821 RepID=UPI0011EED60D|nr:MULTISPECIES: hypothetical protein [unclassified Pseudomonas]KAA0947506.1 hypothetical protein FQ182_10660 [Pseudomonas sp. ANT_H4]KAA0953924.1 hypothetical protein FQ186_05145 [Pseudomonas sp. ANT_H14]
MSSIALFLSALLGGQRYFFSEIYAYACLIPFLLAISNWRGHKPRNTYLVLSVFLTIDITAGVYAGTPSVVRYTIYIAAIVALLAGFKFNLRALVMASILFCFWMTMSVINYEVFSWEQLYRDLQIFLIFFIVLVRAESSIVRHEVDFDLVKKFILVTLISELINVIFFHDLANGYLSLNSTKSFVCAAMLIVLSKKSLGELLMISVLTSIVVIAYGQRMIILVLLFAVGMYLLLNMYNSKKILSLVVGFFVPVALVILFFFIPYINSASEMSGNRSIHLVQAVAKGLSWDLIRSVDQVRFDEHALFFSQKIFPILFGGGLGVGVYDIDNVFRYVQYDQFGFSKTELESGLFFGLHDYWTAVGLRFGLLAAILPCLVLIKGFGNRNSSLVTHSLILFVLLICSSYSIAGLIMIAMIALSYRQNFIQVKYAK